MEEFASLKSLLFLLGGGGITTILTAYLGYKRPTAAPAAPASPIQIESPWMVQNLLQMAQDISAIKNELREIRRVVDRIERARDDETQ